jgi:hypothetical protein
MSGLLKQKIGGRIGGRSGYDRRKRLSSKIADQWTKYGLK